MKHAITFPALRPFPVGRSLFGVGKTEKTSGTGYPIDSSAILFLAQATPEHTNVYRLTVQLREPVSAELLQRAAHRICRRFPTIIAGFRPDLFRYTVVPAAKAPVVRQDPGFLCTMGQEEIESCAYRIYYDQCQIIIEAFHALTDGYGAVASLRALLSEYLFLKYGLSSPERETLLLEQPDWQEELQDAYLYHGKPASDALPQRYAYRIPGAAPGQGLQKGRLHVSTQALRKAAKDSGVSVTSLVAGLMAESIMEIQQRCGPGKMPVRIMVPVDLRRQFPSGTLRNFILYTLPTLEPAEAALPRKQRLQRFQSQIRQQADKKFLAAQISRTAAVQRSPFFRILPRQWKCALTCLINHLMGEKNSSITVTNLGQVPLSEAMRDHIRWIDVDLTPRRQSPYNCGLLSCGDVTSINLTRFGSHRELENLFFDKVRQITAEA